MEDGKLHEPEHKPSFVQKYFSWRYVVALLLQLSIVVNACLRGATPMAIACMIQPSSMSSSPSSAAESGIDPRRVSTNYSFRYQNSTLSQDINTLQHAGSTLLHNESILVTDNATPRNRTYEFTWSSEIIGVVLSSYSFTSFLGPILVNAIRERLGSKNTLALLSSVSATLAFLAPTAARTSPYLLVVVQLIFGLTLKSNEPIFGDCLAWWAPKAEVLTMSSFIHIGYSVGGFLFPFVAGYLCLVPVDNGWPFIYYTFGILTVIFCVVWYMFSAVKPENHRFISENEKNYIISLRTGPRSNAQTKAVKKPYRQMLKSPPLYAYILAISVHCWAVSVKVSYLPIFFTKIMQFTVPQTGMVTSLCYFSQFLGVFLWTFLGNKTASRFGINKSRKFCVAAGYAVCTVCQLIMSFLGKADRWFVVALMILVLMNHSVSISVLSTFPLHMAPRLTGFIIAISSSVCGLIGMSGPLIISAVTSEGTPEQWRTAWLICAGVYTIPVILMLLFGQASLQPWATEDRNVPKEELLHGKRDVASTPIVKSD